MLTVLIATRNGARTLRPVLDAYCELDTPEGGWKLVVVDNGSTDGSGTVVKSFENRLPLTYVLESRDGKNSALNAGLAFVSGDLVVFSDDDVFPRKDWLHRLREAADSRPAFSIFGGVVVPRWEAEPPEWVLNWVPFGPAFAVSDSRLVEGPMEFSHVFGPNMAIRADVFAAGHRFDPTVGPRASGCYAMGSETELVRRLVSLGARAWHVHGAIVEHFVRTTQMRKTWLFGRAERFGRGQYRLAQQSTAGSLPCWFGVPRHLFPKVADKLVSVVKGALRGNAETLFRSRWDLNYLLGQILEARRTSRTSRSEQRLRPAPHTSTGPF